MLLEKQLILPFNVPISYNGVKFYEETFDWVEIENRITNNVLYGMFGDISPEVSLSSVSHKISKIYKYEDGIYGDIEILETNKGKELKLLIAYGYNPIFRFNIFWENNGGGYKISGANVRTKEDDYFDMKPYYRKKKLKKLMNMR